MKQVNGKLKNALFISIVCLLAFVGFSKAGLIFANNDLNVVTVTASGRRFDSSNYLAAMKVYTQEMEPTTTTSETTTVTTTTTTVTTTTTTSVSISQTTVEQFQKQELETTWTGDVLTKQKGVIQGPSGKETYYNLNMSGVVRLMRNIGYSEEEYPYWVREDGVKMLGNYVMVAASFNIRPRGTILESSLGMAIVCDTGGFADRNPTQLDIAVSW